MLASARRTAVRILIFASPAWSLFPAQAAPDPRFAEEPRKAPATSWDVRLGAEGDPGDPFEFTGVIREQDGGLVRGRKVFVYHADNKGQYAERDGPMRYATTLRTDNQGRYRVRTVFPGGYGGHPAHVHFEILEPGRLAGFFNVRQEGRSSGDGFVAKRGRDGVWRLDVDLRPGLTSPGADIGPSGKGYYRPMRQLAPEMWKPPKRDTTSSGQREDWIRLPRHDLLLVLF